MKLNGSEILIETLIEQGAEVIFGYPGGSVLNIYDAIYKYSDKIDHIMTAHEQGAAHAADGYARATGKTGVVLATSGPGATNLVTGIATAYMDSIPMVAITGNVGTSLTGRDSFQEVYIAGITLPVTKHNFVVRDVNVLAETVREAFRIANTGRKGPVLIDIPKDVTAAIAEFENKPVLEIKSSQTVGNLDQIAEVINSAERPVIYFGGGISASGAGNELLELCTRAEIPATYTMMAAGMLHTENPLNLGLIGMHGCVCANRAINNADVVIALGTRFSDRVALNTKKFAEKAKIIQVDIDRSEIGKNVSVDYSITGDVKTVLRELLPKIESVKHTEWTTKIEEWKKADYKPTDKIDRLTPHEIIRSICGMSEDDTIYVTDVGQHQMWAAQYITHTNPRSFLTSGGLGTMGFGYGAALGAKRAFPNRSVVHITGDGSFHMNLNEACTAVSYDLPVITVIMNNTVLGMVRQWQTTFYGKRYSSTDPQRKTDFVKLAEAFGLKGYRCHNLEEFKKAFEQAKKDGCPVWIECLIDKDERVLPMIPAGGSLEDMITD